jgi:hypothetical protein
MSATHNSGGCERGGERGAERAPESRAPEGRMNDVAVSSQKGANSTDLAGQRQANDSYMQACGFSSANSVLDMSSLRGSQGAAASDAALAGKGAATAAAGTDARSQHAEQTTPGKGMTSSSDIPAQSNKAFEGKTDSQTPNRENNLPNPQDRGASDHAAQTVPRPHAPAPHAPEHGGHRPGHVPHHGGTGRREAPPTGGSGHHSENPHTTDQGTQTKKRGQ